MSILLEALKKSEQSRQLGTTPTLDTPVEGASAPDGPSGSMVTVLLIVLSSVTMVWFGWQQFVRPEPVDTAAEPVVVTSSEEPGPEISDSAESAPRTMTESYQAPAETPPAAQLAGEDGDAAEKQKLRQSVEQFVAESESEPEPATADAELATDAELPADAELAADAQAAMEQLAQQREPRQQAAEDPGLEPHIAEPISYWELPQGVRDNLPEIKITVLVYAVEPGDRFVLTNGQRLVERDELDSGLVLEEIRRDGAVFTYRNYRFLVKG